MDIKVTNRNSRKQIDGIKPIAPLVNKKTARIDSLRSLKFFEIVLLYSSLIVIISLLLLIYKGGNKQSDYVKTKNFQAVFLNGGISNGQVIYSTYFGHIVSVSDKYIVLKDVYFIAPSTASSKTANSNVQLTKLGCQQIHSPLDQMVINVSQVSFWENLDSTGKVASSIAAYEKANPKGTNCSESTSNSTSTSSTNPQPSQDSPSSAASAATTPPTSTAPVTTTPTTNTSTTTPQQ